MTPFATFPKETIDNVLKLTSKSQTNNEHPPAIPCKQRMLHKKRTSAFSYCSHATNTQFQEIHQFIVNSLLNKENTIQLKMSINPL